MKDFFGKSIIFRSFRLRIFLILFFTGFVVAEVMRFGLYSNYREHSIQERIMKLTEQGVVTAGTLLSYDYIRNPKADAMTQQLSLLSRIYDGRVMVVDSAYQVVADTYRVNVGRTMIGEEVIRCSRGETVTRHDKKNHFIEVLVPILSSDSSIYHGVLILSSSTEDILRNADTLRHNAGIIEAVILILLLGVSVAVSAVVVKPFKQVTKAIGSTVTFDDEMTSVTDYVETQEIVEAFLKQRARLKLLDDSRQEFVSNVSHELKTPIASIKVLADSLNMQGDAPVELYREFMQDIATEVDRENKIISDLLELVRMDQGAGALHVENKSINEMLEAIVKRLAPLARKEEVDLILESRRSVMADIDEIKVSQAITNIIENGIKYNKHPGWVKIVLDADHQYVIIDISDSGLGIPAETREHIFERFYRGDKSHSQEISGTGLGLAIARRTMVLHRGTIEVESVVNEGSTFHVRIPLSFVKERK